MDDKYVVFKRSEWDEFRKGLLSAPILGDFPGKIDDAVVIRTKDIFAGPVLHTYAGAVQTAIEVIQGTNATTSTAWIEHLEQVRDYFTDRAQEADSVQQKRFPKASS